jgi:hypothetical protein
MRKIEITTIHVPKAVAGSQNASKPFQAKGPVLKNGMTAAGTNSKAIQILKKPSQRGNTGLVDFEPRTTKPNKRFSANPTAQMPTNMSQPTSLSACVISIDRSGRKLAAIHIMAGTTNNMMVAAPMASCA